jgi:NADP-dependent 3-hydroxy acid dehydrogenase YdfG
VTTGADVLTGRTALVTGASRGIGQSVAERLADAGARVWCLARSGKELRAVSSDLGGEALTVDLADDVATWEALDAMVEAIGGAPDIVVNAAGVFGLASCATESVAAFDRALEVNLRGPFLVNRALLPSMLERGKGLIVNVGSVSGRKAYPGNGAYSASKFGLRGYHEVLLDEIRGTGVRATLIEPAATDTPLWDALDPDADPALPSRRDMLRAVDVAEAVLFVATRPESVRIPLIQIERA